MRCHRSPQVWLLHFFLLGIISGGSLAVENCPSSCNCYFNFGPIETVTVDCHGRDLTSVPSQLPAGTTHLDLSNNWIQTVTRSSFGSEAAGLLHLQLQNNDLQLIEAGAFQSLARLQTLFLYNNYQLGSLEGILTGLSDLRKLVAYNIGLTSISSGFLDPVPSLSEIDLNFNQLRSIPSGAFSDLPRLKDISLSNNFITSLEPASFRNLTVLYYLSLRFNHLRSVGEQSLQDLTRLLSLDLTGNPIQCTCSARYLQQFLMSQQLGGPRCSGPEQFAGKHLLDLDTATFCATPTATIADSVPILVLLNSSHLQLNCLATGIPLPTITWSRDGMILEDDRINIAMEGGALAIAMVTTEDSGDYHCSASSSAGVAISSQQVLVLAPPTFSNLVGVALEDSVLNCGDDPLPSGTATVWYFNGSVIDIMSQNYARLQNGSLLVREAGLEDMGVYTCQVGGQVNFSISLTVLARPDILFFTEGPCDDPGVLMVDSIGALALRCEAFGIPAPTVTLSLGETVLASQDPPPGMMGGVVSLVHDLVLLRGDGNYTCTANSSLGNSSRHRTVRVRMIELARGNMSVASLTAFAGEVVVMDCPTQVSDAGSVTTWRRADALPIPFETRANLSCSNQTLILRRAVSTYDTAVYECEVQTPSGRRYLAEVFLTVNEPATINKMCGLSVVIGTVGGVAMLPCQSQGISDFDRTWMEGGSEIVSEGRFTISEQMDGTLSISSLELSDSGVYTCTIKNRVALGEEVLGPVVNDSYSIQLVVRMPPEFLTVPANISVSQGGSVKLPCSGTASPSPALSWWRMVGGNLTEVITDGQYFVTENFLLLPEVFERRDEGIYFCMLTSEAGNLTSDPIFLDILTSPTLSGSHRPRHTFKLGTENATLTCNGSGDPLPQVSWLRSPDLSLLPGDSANYRLIGSDLVIVNAAREDAGLYLCRLNNSVGVTFFNVTVVVKAPPETSVFPASVRANVGCQVTFRCLDGENPPSGGSFQWFRNGAELATSGNLAVMADGRLVLSDVSPQDSGNFSCTIRGSGGEAVATASLTVAMIITSLARNVSITTLTPPTQALAVHQVVQFVCLVEGNPPPQVRWLRNGNPVPNFNRVANLNESLRIRDLRQTDSGTYSCVANNSLGQDSREFQLLVGVPPFIVRHPVSREVEEGEDLRLVCTANGVPFPNITWFFNNTEIEINDVCNISADRTILIVRDVSVDASSGIYRCRAQNFAGVAFHSTSITVVEATRAPTIILDPPTNVEVPFGESFAISSNMTGLPQPDLLCHFNGQPLPTCPAGMATSLTCVEGGVVMIAAMETSNEGLYSCTANNSQGEASYQIRVGLLEELSPPFFVVSPRPLWLTNASQFSLDCVAMGNPTPNVTWQLNRVAVNLTLPEFTQQPNNSLLVTRVATDTVGTFTCRADNGRGLGHSFTLVDILPPDSSASLSPPRLTLFPASVLSVLPGQSLVLDCRATGSPAPTITWTRNERPLDFASLPSVQLASNGSLIFIAVTGQEEGNYSCRAVNKAGVSEVAFFLDIEDGLITGTSGDEVAPITNVTQLSGTDVSINCTVPGVLVGRDRRFVWRHRGQLLCGGRGGELLLSQLKVEQSGRYECLALSGRTLMKTTVHLTVLPKNEPPYFLVEPYDRHAVKRGFVVLPCQAASPGGEETNLRWFHGHTPLAGHGEKHLILKNGSLLLSNVYPAQAGNYSCQASNKYGRSLVSAQVTVSKSPVGMFLRELEGSPLLLACQLGQSGDLKWVKDNRVAVPSYFGLLWKPRLEQSDEGEYTCSLNKSSFNYYLVVQVPPKILTASSALSASRGGVATLNCLATGKPRPTVRWYYGNLQLERGEKFSIVANGSLLVYNVEGTDAGLYTCMATNPQGVAELRVLLGIAAG